MLLRVSLFLCVVAFAPPTVRLGALLMVAIVLAGVAVARGLMRLDLSLQHAVTATVTVQYLLLFPSINNGSLAQGPLAMTMLVAGMLAGAAVTYPVVRKLRTGEGAPVTH